MGRTLHRIASTASALLAIAATVAMSQALTGDGEVRTIFLVPKDGGAGFVAVLSCVMFAPPFIGLATLGLAWRPRPSGSWLFSASAAALLLAGAWWLSASAPRTLMLAAAGSFVVAALTGPRMRTGSPSRTASFAWLGAAALVSSLAVVLFRALAFFNATDVAASFGHDDIELLMGQLMLPPIAAASSLIRGGRGHYAVRALCLAGAALELFALSVPLAAPVPLTVVTAALLLALALPAFSAADSRTAEPTPSRSP